MNAFRHLSLVFAMALCVSLLAPVSAPAEETRASGERSLGTLILEGVEAGIATERLARKVQERSRELRREWTGEPVIEEEVVEEYEEERDDRETQGKSAKGKKEKRGQGPPDWAPAHGWRAKFGEQEETDLGRFANRKVEEGLTGDELVVAIRGKIDRIARGERNDEDDATRGDGSRDESRESHGGDSEREDDDRGGKGRSGDKGKGKK